MKSIKQSKCDSITYPILKEGIISGMVILFTSIQTGTVVFCNPKSKFNKYSAGDYAETWVQATNDAHWKNFTGTLKLNN